MAKKITIEPSDTCMLPSNDVFRTTSASKFIRRNFLVKLSFYKIYISNIILRYFFRGRDYTIFLIYSFLIFQTILIENTTFRYFYNENTLKMINFCVKLSKIIIGTFPT